MNRFLYLSGVCWLVSGALCPGETEKPNVVFILADDLGIGDVGCYGSDHRRTPHLDKLASGGTRFTQFFTGALCGPSRALIMSGRYAFRNGSTNQDACRRLPLSELHLGRLFKEAGYATSAIGKWGQLPGEPLDVGYDDSLRFNGSGVYWGSGEEVRYLRNGREMELRQGQYMPDLMQEHALASSGRIGRIRFSSITVCPTSMARSPRRPTVLRIGGISMRRTSFTWTNSSGR